MEKTAWILAFAGPQAVGIQSKTDIKNLLEKAKSLSGTIA
jgi:hypothetical protein